jgi:Zn ribbon nucleic-acid-binding protein
MWELNGVPVVACFKTDKQRQNATEVKRVRQSKPFYIILFPKQNI